MSACLVLHVTRRHAPEDDPRLAAPILEAPALIAVVGTGCERWEDRIHELCVDLHVSGRRDSPSCNAASHPGETLESVLQFAGRWARRREVQDDPRVVEIRAP